MEKPKKHPSVQEKMTMMANLYRFAFKIKKFQILQKYPNLSEVEIDRKVYAMIENGCK